MILVHTKNLKPLFSERLFLEVWSTWRPQVKLWFSRELKNPLNWRQDLQSPEESILIFYDKPLKINTKQFLRALPRSRYCVKSYPVMVSMISFHKWGNLNLERFSNLPWVMSLVGGRTRIQCHVNWLYCTASFARSGKRGREIQLSAESFCLDFSLKVMKAWGSSLHVGLFGLPAEVNVGLNSVLWFNNLDLATGAIVC